MRMLLLYILLVAFGCQQTPFLESENLKTSESEKGCEQRAMSNEQKSPNAQGSQHEAQSLKKTVDCCPLTVDYFENQIRLADSLYKNYLPQYNFEEVKAAVMFFDSCEQRAMSHEPFSETEKSVNISEICGNEKTNHKLAQKKSEKGCEPRAMSNEQKSQNAQGSQHEAQSLKKTVDCCPLTVDNPEDYEKIRFVSLIYTRLGQLFLSENYCDLAILKYKKALEYVEILGNDYSKSQIFKFIGNSFHLYNMSDSALFYYNKSLKTDSNSTNRLDVEKSISKILFERGERDGTYVMMKSNLDKIDNINVRYS